MALEICGNCGRTIGKLETAYVFDGRIVCADCNQILCRQKIRSSINVQAESQIQNSSVQRGQNTNKTGEGLIVNVKGIKSTSGLGIAALVLGIIACIGCWIPFCGIMIIPFCLIGILIGIVGFFASALGKRTTIGMPVAGIFVCMLAIVIAISSTNKAAKAIGEVEKVTKSSRQEAVSPLTDKIHKNIQESASEANSKSTANEKENEESWAQATSPVKQDDIQIQIISVDVNTVKLKEAFGGGIEESKDLLLSIRIEIKNMSQTKKINYKTWAGKDFAFSRDYATLADNFGNSYRRITFGSDKPVDRVEDESLYPRKAITDILVFERPIENIEFLRLELPAKNFDGVGMIRFQIPKSMITRDSM